MTKQTEKSMAINLRQQGLSYSEIEVRMKADGCRVSKGSLTNWLKNVPLTEEQKAELLRKEHVPGLEAIKRKKAAAFEKAKIFAREDERQIDMVLLDGGFLDASASPSQG